jgi:hypothetical protein
MTFGMRRALLAIVVLVAGSTSSVWGQPIDRQTLLRVRLATDASQVASCQRLGLVSDTSPEDLRKKILRGGGDTGLVTFDAMDPDKMNAEVYRCQKPVAVAPTTAAAVTPGDPTAIQNVLVGTWKGTMVYTTYIERGVGPQRMEFPATVQVVSENGQLRWTMNVGGPNLDGSGTLTHYFSDITLTGQYGPGGQPITYSLRLSSHTLQGAGVGPDQVIRNLSLRKQP